MRLMRLKIVLLPAPLGPTMAKISPSVTSKDTPSTALMPPKEIEMSCGLEQGRAGRAAGFLRGMPCSPLAPAFADRLDPG